MKKAKNSNIICLGGCKSSWPLGPLVSGTVDSSDSFLEDPLGERKGGEMVFRTRIVISNYVWNCVHVYAKINTKSSYLEY